MRPATAPVSDQRSLHETRPKNGRLQRNSLGGSLRNSATLARRAKKFEITQAQDDYGLLSRGEDSRLANNEEEQKKYFAAIQRRYIRFCYDAGDGAVLKAALRAVEKTDSFQEEETGGNKGDKVKEDRKGNPPAIDSIIMSLRKLREAMIAQTPSEFTKAVFLFSVRVTSTMGHYQSYVPSVLKLLEVHATVPLTNAEVQEVCGIYALYLSIVSGCSSEAYLVLDRNDWKDSRLLSILRAWDTKDYVSWAQLCRTESDLGRSKIMQSGDPHMAMEGLKRIGKTYFSIHVDELEKLLGWKWAAIKKELNCGWREEDGGRIVIRERRQQAPRISVA